MQTAQRFTLNVLNRFALLISSLLVVGGACSAPPTVTPSLIEYVGHVFDQDTDFPISNAKVTLDFQDAPPVVYTDSEGAYRFIIPAESDKVYGRIRVEANNYKKYDRNVILYAKPTTLEEIHLIPAIPATETTTVIATPPITTVIATSPTAVPVSSIPAITQLTANKWNNFTPSFSPDDQKIIFISDQNGNCEIYVMNTDGTQSQRLTDTPNITEDVPTYSPDGTKIIFGGYNGYNEDIYMMNADGSQYMNITNRPNSNEGRPRISPSGRFVTFDSDRSGNWEIHLAELQDNWLTDIKQVTTRPDFADRFPSISSFGNMILFRAEIVGQDSESSQLYLSNLDGTNLHRILDFPNMYYPAISPDSKWIAFVSRKEGNAEIYVMALDGSGLQRLTDHPADDTDPAFSYDGKWIIFASKRMGANFNIFRMQFDPTAY